MTTRVINVSALVLAIVSMGVASSNAVYAKARALPATQDFQVQDPEIASGEWAISLHVRECQRGEHAGQIVSPRTVKFVCSQNASRRVVEELAVYPCDPGELSINQKSVIDLYTVACSQSPVRAR